MRTRRGVRAKAVEVKATDAVLVDYSDGSAFYRIGDPAWEIRYVYYAAAHWKPSSAGTYGLVRVVHRFDGELYRNHFVATPWSTFTNWERPARRNVERELSVLPA